jgi:hypothetical protein
VAVSGRRRLFGVMIEVLMAARCSSGAMWWESELWYITILP